MSTLSSSRVVSRVGQLIITLTQNAHNLWVSRPAQIMFMIKEFENALEKPELCLWLRQHIFTQKHPNYEHYDHNSRLGCTLTKHAKLFQMHPFHHYMLTMNIICIFNFTKCPWWQIQTWKSVVPYGAFPMSPCHGSWTFGDISANCGLTLMWTCCNHYTTTNLKLYIC